MKTYIPKKIILDKSIIDEKVSNTGIGNYGVDLGAWVERKINDSSIDIATPALAVSAPTELLGRFTIKTKKITHTVDIAGFSSSIDLLIPAGVMLLGASFNVNTAVTTDSANNTWSAAFITGSTATLAPTSTAGAVNTKSDVLIVPEISSAVTEISFSAGGGQDFASGVIEVVVYYAELTSLADA